MKFIYAAFFLNILFLTSCKTTKPITETTTEQKEQKTQEPTIIGRWKLNKLSGGIVGREQDPPIGQVIVIEFTPTELITIINGKINNLNLFQNLKLNFLLSVSNIFIKCKIDSETSSE